MDRVGEKENILMDNEGFTSMEFEKLKAMLERSGIPFTVEDTGERLEYFKVPGGKIIHLEVGTHDHDKLVGYLGFMAEFMFDANGSLVKAGIWE